MDGSTPRILKKGSAEAAARCSDEILAMARDRARELVAAAEAEAARLEEEARAEALRARAAAVEEGHREGMARAAALLALVAEVRESKLKELDAAVVEVAVEIARRILERELSLSGAIVDVAKRALRAAAGCGDIVLRVAPGDVASLGEADGELEALVQRGSLTVTADPGLGRGEVVVEASAGRVDARIEAQLEPLRRALQSEGG